jgi:hypothetical protein
MCTPVTLAAMAVSTAVQSYSQYQAARFEAETNGLNAGLARASAANAERRGAAAAGQIRSDASQFISEQKVAVSADGIDTASAAGLFASTRALSEQDALTAKHNAVLEAYGHRIEEAQYRVAAKMARRKSALGPLSTLASGGAQMGAFKAGK